MEQNTLAYLLGKLIGGPLILALVAYIVLRFVVKKRKLTPKEKLIPLAVALGALLMVLVNAAIKPGV